MSYSIQETYDKIAQDFDRTRYSVWQGTKQYLDSIKEGDTGLEVGCGNGKNMLYRKDLNLFGIDISQNFVDICLRKNLNVVQADMLCLPFVDNYLDFAFSIAVLHHLDTRELRIQALQEMFRVCRPHSKIFVQVWAFEQEDDAKRKFETYDELVSWQCKTDGKIYYRYYHLYKEGELLKEFIDTGLEFAVIRDFYEKGNWGLVIEKL